MPKKQRPILNFYTRVNAEQTIGEIQKMLAEHGATAVLTEYGPDSTVAAVSFRIKHNEQEISFRLPAKVDPIYVLLQNDNSTHSRPKFRTRNHAASVAWRIVRQWIEAQLALVQAEQVEMVEVFLPFAQDPRTGATVFDRLAKDNFKLLTGPKT